MTMRKVDAEGPVRVEQVPVERLQPAAHNPRTHSQSQLEKLMHSIQTFGFINPILADDGGRIIAGHGRWEAAKRMGMPIVPVVRIRHLTAAQRRAYLVADNRLAELAGWDRELLKLELGELLIEAPELDLTVTGFEVGEIDRLLLEDEVCGEIDDRAADAIPQRDEEVICRRGDLWQLGGHRLLIGDAREPACYRRLLGDERAALVFTDPPYNVRIDGHARGKGRQQHREFVMASGELSQGEFSAFLAQTFAAMSAVSRPGAVHYVCMDWRHLREVLAAGDKVYEALLNLCVWDKEAGGMGSFYRSQHELVLVWRLKGGTHRNNVALGRFGRNRTNVWRHPGANVLGSAGKAMLAMHPTVKPAALVAGAILDASKPRDIVLDPFLGSGTTIIAAEKTGRFGRGLELDPAYGDVIIRRVEAYTGITAVNVESGLTFAEEAARRYEGHPPLSPRCETAKPRGPRSKQSSSD
jgi:DNA modification methylase